MSTFATANVYGEIREEVDLPYIKKTGDTATGEIIFDGGIQTNVGTATFNGPIIATDNITFTPVANLFCNCPSEFADSVTITGGPFVVDVPSTFNDSVIYNDSLQLNGTVSIDGNLGIGSTSVVTLDGAIDINGATNFNSTPTFNGGANFIGGGAQTTVQSTGMVVNDPTVSRLSNFLANSLSINDTTVGSTVLASLNTQTLTLQNDVNNYLIIDNSVGGPSIDIRQNDGGSTNRQANLNTTSVSCFNLAITPQSGFYAQSNGTIASFSTNAGVLAPQLLLQNINTASGAGNGVNMQTFKQKGGAPGVTGDEVFRLAMFAENANNDKEEYGRITCNVRDASAPTAGADGQILLAVPVGDTMTTFLDLNGNSNQVKIFKPLVFPDNTIQTTAYTGGTNIISSQVISPLNNNALNTWAYLTTPTNTNFMNLYIMAGGGRTGAAIFETVGSPKTTLGGGGGSGGSVVYSQSSIGAISNYVRVLIQPQFVYSPLYNPTTPVVWTGTFTQSGTTITVVSTTSGSLSVGKFINFTSAAYNASYASPNIYAKAFNQLYIVSGSGSTWTVRTVTSQTLAVAIQATAYTPEILWSGSFTQSGNTVSAFSTTYGSFPAGGFAGNYLVSNAGGTVMDTQYMTGDLTASTQLSNFSQTIASPIAGYIFVTRKGSQVYAEFNNYLTVATPYTAFPAIASCFGGENGQNGISADSPYVPGIGGPGGTCIAHMDYCAQTNQGSKGQNGSTNDDPSGFTNKSTSGGQNITLYNKSIVLNSVNTRLDTTYNGGGYAFSTQGGAVNYFGQGLGGVVLVSLSE